jgi:hypothetical protein
VESSADTLFNFVSVIRNDSSVTAFDIELNDVAGVCWSPYKFISASANVIGTGPKFTISQLDPGGTAEVRYSLDVFHITTPPAVFCYDCNALKNEMRATWTSLKGEHGTTSNATLAAVTAPSGASNGERNGDPVSTKNPANTYANSASYVPCGNVCGTKFNDLHAPFGTRDSDEPGLQGWTISATVDIPKRFSPTNVKVETADDGSYCLPIVAGLPYKVCETQLTGWQATTPDGGCAQVTVGVGGTTKLDFGNHKQ